ncbi:MAG: TetR/AcrR family transcriptional regulator [Pseudomonadota bacterium]
MSEAPPDTPSSDRRTQAERTALSDERMLDAAVDLIVNDGPTGMTLKAVGEKAGYSRGLASYRFGNKAGLFAFVVRSIGEKWLTELRSAVETRCGLEAIAAALDAHYQFITRGDHDILAFYTLWFDSIGPDPELKQVIANIHERRRRDVADWIGTAQQLGDLDNEIDPDDAANQFCAAIIGIVYQWLVTPEDLNSIRDLHDALKQQMQQLLHPNPTATPKLASVGA